MDSDVWIWLLVIGLAVLALVALGLGLASRRKTSRDARRRQEAQELRAEADERAAAVRRSDLEAREAKLSADRARLEAEQAAARAEEASRARQVEEAQYEDRLRAADRVDPAVDHRATDYSPTEPSAQGHTTAADEVDGRPDPSGPGSRGTTSP